MNLGRRAFGQHPAENVNKYPTCEARKTGRGLFFITEPDARSSEAINFENVAGTSREWWNNSICASVELSSLISDEKLLRHTEVPLVIGTWISKMMIRALNTVASGTRFPGEHRTLPILRWMGSIDVKYKVTLEPAAAHDTLLSSILIAEMICA